MQPGLDSQLTEQQVWRSRAGSLAQYFTETPGSAFCSASCSRWARSPPHGYSVAAGAPTRMAPHTPQQKKWRGPRISLPSPVSFSHRENCLPFKPHWQGLGPQSSFKTWEGKCLSFLASIVGKKDATKK